MHEELHELEGAEIVVRSGLDDTVDQYGQELVITSALRVDRREDADYLVHYRLEAFGN